MLSAANGNAAASSSNGRLPLLPAADVNIHDAGLPSSMARPPTDNKNKLRQLAGRGQLAIAFSLFVVLRAMDRVFNKRVNDRMVNYQMAFVNVFWPVGVQLMTCVMCAAWVAHQRYNHRDVAYGCIRFFSPVSHLASARGSYPQWRLALFSFWDQLNAIMTSLPSPFIDMTSQSIISNLVVIWTAAISIVYIGTRYAQEHLIGCLLIVLSCIVCVVVQLQTGQPPLGRYALPGGGSAISSPSWYILFLAGTLPAGISNCFKQKCLKGVDLDVMYATLWSGNWQIMWGLLLFPLNWIPLPSPAPRHTPSELGGYLHDSLTCFVGVAPTNSTGDRACAAPGGAAALWFAVYLMFNVSFNVLLLWLTKRMSATWATIATVLCLDLTAVLSMSKALMGDEAQPVALQQYLGLCLAAIAMWVYNLQPERDVHGEIVEGAHVLSQRPSTLAALAGADGRASLMSMGRASSLSIGRRSTGGGSVRSPDGPRRTTTTTE